MRPQIALACPASLLLAACGSPPKERYYTLTVAATAPAPAAGASAVSIAVGPVTVPEWSTSRRSWCRSPPTR